eukprot:PhM_4_TR5896/c1_g1_i2/m.67503
MATTAGDVPVADTVAGHMTVKTMTAANKCTGVPLAAAHLAADVATTKTIGRSIRMTKTMDTPVVAGAADSAAPLRAVGVGTTTLNPTILTMTADTLAGALRAADSAVP